MGFLDNAGLTYFWGKVKTALAGKQNTITPGEGLEKSGDTIGLTTPTRGIVTQEEFDALPEEQKVTGFWVIAPRDKILPVKPVVRPHIYGAVWDGTGTKWSRTDDAADFADPVPYVAGASSYGSPFDNLSPWSGMVKCERAGGTMVAVPKFWYKLEQAGAGGLKIQIADGPAEGFVPSPMHMDRGDGKGERDMVYIGRYHCGSDYKSKSGVKPAVNLTLAQFQNGIHALGSSVWQGDFLMRFTIWLLFIVEYAEFNSEIIGYGCGNAGSTEAMGYTDSMPYHTGTMLDSRNEYGVGIQYRYIEGLWENAYEQCNGCYYDSAGFHIILNPENFGSRSGGASVGTYPSGIPSAYRVTETGGFPVFIPLEIGGNASEASCDFWYTPGNYPVILGAAYHQVRECGLFCVYYHSGEAFNDVGSRAQELP